jgi:bacterioferritin
MTRRAARIDVPALCERARNHIPDGAVTAGYSGDRREIVALLNDALATEIVCVLRYRRHYFTARGIHSQSVAEEFVAHSNEELGHAESVAGDSLTSKRATGQRIAALPAALRS